MKHGQRLFLALLLSVSFHTDAQPSARQAALAEAFAKAVPAEVIDSVARRLRREFDVWLEKPEAYRRRALNDCAIFPEGGIYPFAIPAMAYANIAFKNPAETDQAQPRMRILLDLVIRATPLGGSRSFGGIFRMARR